MKLELILDMESPSLSRESYRERSMCLDGQWYISRRYPDRIEVYHATQLSPGELAYLRTVEMIAHDTPRSN